MGTEIEDIKSRLNIVDVLGEYIKLDKAGSNWRALCPFHNEKSPSFMVNEERQMWHCFGCQKSGDIFSFVMEMDGLEFRDALKQLAEKAGVQLKSYNPKKTEEKNRTLEILELATKWYEHQLWNGPGKTKIINYLRERGLKDETVKEFRLGYAPKGWRNISSFLLGRGYKAEEILKTGLLVEKRDAQIPNSKFQISNKIQNTKYPIQNTNFYDRFRERIMFPVADYSGRVVGYSARVAPGGDESQAKYVNTPETEVYHKSRILFGLDKAKSEIKQKNFALLVEGNMDVIAAHQAGIKNTVAASGTALAGEQIAILKRYAPKVKMFFDMDGAGEAATKKSVKLCLASDMAVEVVIITAGKDAADIVRENPGILLEAVEKSLGVMEYFLQKLYKKFDRNEAEGKRKITEECLDIIFYFENPVEKSHWIKKLSEDLSVPEAALTDALKKISLKSRMDDYGAGKKEIVSAPARSKFEMLEEELIGLALISKDIWKKAWEQKEEVSLLSKDSLLNIILENAEKLDFDFDNLAKFLDDSKIKTRAEDIFFRKRYRLDLNNNPEEIIFEEPLKELETCLREMKMEAKKKERMRLTADLKTAEEKNDESAKKFLRQEFDKISKELMEMQGRQNLREF